MVQRLDPPGVGARDLRECLLLQLMPGMPYYEQLQTLISSHLEDLEHNRLPVIARQDRLLDRADPGDARRAAQAESQAGGRLFSDVHAPTVTPDVFVGRRRKGAATRSARRRPHAEPVHQPLLPQAVDARQRDQRRNPRIHQAEDQLGPVADRLDRAAAQHADAGGPGDRRPPDGVSRQGPRGDRAAEDAADRRQGGRARHDGQPGGRRQVDPDAPRHLSR